MNNIEIKLQDGRSISLELYEGIAPITVKNFLKLIDEKYFDGLIFHRVIDGFMIQAGGYYIENMTLMEKHAKTIKGEFSSNGVKNDLKHTLGVISMARTNDPNSASGQFFICVNDTPHLDGNYAAFGKVNDEESLKVILDIAKVKTINIGYGFSDFPKDPVVIETIIKK